MPQTYLDCIHVRKEEKGRPSVAGAASSDDINQPASDEIFYLPPGQVWSGRDQVKERQRLQ